MTAEKRRCGASCERLRRDCFSIARRSGRSTTDFRDSASSVAAVYDRRKTSLWLLLVSACGGIVLASPYGAADPPLNRPLELRRRTTEMSGERSVVLKILQHRIQRCCNWLRFGEPGEN